MANEKILERLENIQAQLKVPKGQINDYGGFNYRSCEDILEAVKPLLKENKCVLTITDDVVAVGERFYIKATATITSSETGESISSNAFAREQLSKKGMDEAQVTGAASSYARKYALNGLFCIDDTKDPDTYDKPDNSSNALICPQCGKPVKPQRKQKNGQIVEIPPADVLKGCGGICFDCYKIKGGQK